MQHRLYGLRGKVYVKKYKTIFQEEGSAIAQRFKEMQQKEGKFTPPMLGEICNEFRLPVKVMDEFLADLDVGYPAGTWQRLKDRGCTAKMIGVEWK